MRCTWIVGPTLVVALGACAAQPANDDMASGASTPTGFETWLERACPAGRQMALYDRANGGEPRMIVTCEDLRQKAMAEEGARQRLIDVYLSQTASTVEGGSEDVGEAKEPITLFGILCLALGTGAGLGSTFDCAHHPEDASCAYGSAAGVVALAVVCALI